MPFQYEIKEWDSDFFGYGVASLTGWGDNDAFKVILKRMKENNIRLCYWIFESDRTELKEIATGNEYHVADVRLTFVCRKKNVQSPEFNKIRKLQWDDYNDNLAGLAAQCGEYSRFRKDKTFPEGSFERMYTLWMQKALKEDIVFAYGEEKMTLGFAAVKGEPDGAHFYLLAVDGKARTKGIGKLLTQKILSWSFENKYEKVFLLTQKENVPASKLFLSLGFEIEREEEIYHLWL
ncbi:MAG: GNAT family N-acetyltransferase [Chitinophagales bacterium]|nr:GNAT family N-acetyltransferase [Chitinophagales bacterium]